MDQENNEMHSFNTFCPSKLLTGSGFYFLDKAKPAWFKSIH
jgi:hypothetical protein